MSSCLMTEVFKTLTTSGGGLAGVDVADNDDVDVKLLLTESAC